MSQRQLADLVGVTQPVVAEFESTPRTGLGTAIRIAKALGAEIRVELVELWARNRRRAA